MSDPEPDDPMGSFGTRKLVPKPSGQKGNQPQWLCKRCPFKRNGGPIKLLAHCLGRYKPEGVTWAIEFHKQQDVRPCEERWSVEEKAAMHKLYKQQQASSSKLVEQQKQQRLAQALDNGTGTDATPMRSIGSSCAPGTGSRRQMTLDDSFNVQRHEDASEACAEMFYGCGLSHNLARNPLFKRFIQKAQAAGPSWKPPSYNDLRGKWLVRVKKKISVRLKPVLDSVARSGCSLISDGWSGVQNRPLLNIMVATPSGPMMVESFNAEGAEKDAAFLAELMGRHIEKLGPKNVVCVITDSATVNEAAANLLRQRFPHVFWVRCSSHGVNLMLKDIGGLAWASKWIKAARQVVKFLRNHHKSQYLIRVHSSKLPDETHRGKELLSPATTRFATSVIMLGRMVELKPALKSMIADPEWFNWARKQSVKKKATWVQKQLQNKEFWEWADRLVRLLTPVLSLLRQTDSAKPAMGEVLGQVFRVRDHLKKFDYGTVDTEGGVDQLRFDVLKIFDARWKWMRSPLHSVGWMLNPNNLSAYLQLQADSRDDDEKEHVFAKVLKDRKAVFQAILGDDWQYNAAMAQHTQYLKLDLQAKAASSNEGWEPWEWWHNGDAAQLLPNLKMVAERVLAQPSSAAASEHNWSNHDFIINKRRNKLSVQHAEDLVFVFSNMKLLLHVNTPEFEQARIQSALPNKPLQDNGGDETDPEPDASGSGSGSDGEPEPEPDAASGDMSDFSDDSEMVTDSASDSYDEPSRELYVSDSGQELEDDATAMREHALMDAYQSSPEGVTRPGRPRKKAVAAKPARATKAKATAKGSGAAGASKRKGAAATRGAKAPKKPRK